MPKDRTPRRRPGPKTRQTPPAPTRRRWPWVFAGFSLILVAFAAFGVLRSPLLQAQNVRVEGAQTLDQAGVIELSGLAGRSMLRLPLAEARARLLDLPQVKAVVFLRRWPQSVTIRIEERLPYAFWSVGGRDYVVDVDGVVLGAGAPSGPAYRVVEPDSSRIMGPGDRVHPDALALAARITLESPRFLGQGVRELEYRPGIGVTAVFSKGMRVTFGDDRAYAYKVAVLAKLLDQLSARGVSPRTVDLRFGERVTYE